MRNTFPGDRDAARPGRMAVDARHRRTRTGPRRTRVGGTREAVDRRYSTTADLPQAAGRHGQARRRQVRCAVRSAGDLDPGAAPLTSRAEFPPTRCRPGTRRASRRVVGHPSCRRGRRRCDGRPAATS